MTLFVSCRTRGRKEGLFTSHTNTTLLLTLFAVLLFLPSFAAATTLLNFSDGTGGAGTNLTYILGTEVYYKQLLIPLNSTVNNAVINITGFSASSDSDMTTNHGNIANETFPGFFQHFVGDIFNPQYADDDNDATYTRVLSPGANVNVNYLNNFSVNGTVTSATLFIHGSDDNIPYNTQIYCLNRSNNVSWINIGVLPQAPTTYGFPVSAYCLNFSTINFNISIQPGFTRNVYFWDMYLFYTQLNSSYPTNVTLILNNNTVIFNYGATNGSTLNHEVVANITSFFNLPQVYPQNISFVSISKGIIEYSALFIEYSLISQINIFPELYKDFGAYRGSNITILLKEGNGTIHYLWSTTGIVTFPNPSSSGVTEIEFFDNRTFNYPTRHFFFKNFETDLQNISIYLINSSNVSQTLFTLKDENGQPLVGYYIGVYKKYLPTGTFDLIEMHKTDDNGQALLNTQLYIALYKFNIYNQNLDPIYTSAETEIKSTSLTLNVRLGENIFTGLSLIFGINMSSIRFDNTTKQFIFTYDDRVNIVGNMTFKTIRRTNFGDIPVCNNISSASSATLYCTLDENASGTYIATVVVSTKTNHSDIYVQRAEWSKSGVETASKMGTAGLLAMLFLGIGLVLLGLFNPVVAIGLSLVALIFGFIAHIIYIQIGYITVLVILGGILIMKMRA